MCGGADVRWTEDFRARGLIDMCRSYGADVRRTEGPDVTVVCVAHGAGETVAAEVAFGEIALVETAISSRSSRGLVVALCLQRGVGNTLRGHAPFLRRHDTTHPEGPMSADNPADLPRSADIVVIGAGLAGLCAVLELQRGGRNAVLLEASDGVGGRVRSDRVEGFILDRGFQILLTAYPEVRRQLDLDALNLRAFVPGAAVWLDDKAHLIGDPLRDPRVLIPTLRSPIGSLKDKAQIGRLRQRVRSGHARDLLRAPETSTIEHLKSMGFSDKIIDRFLRPLFAGIQLDPSLETSSRMFDIIFRSLSEGDSVVPASGMQAIPNQLAARLEAGSIHLNTRVRRIAGSRVHTDRGEIEAPHVVVATDAPAAAALLDVEITPSMPVGCVWFDAPESPAKALGLPPGTILLDGSSRGPALNVAILSDVAPSYAPPNRTLVAAACAADIGEDLEQRVSAQLRGWFGELDGWNTLRVDRIAHAQPGQKPPFGPKKRVRLDDGLWVCGDHRDTGSIQGAMYSGRRTAEAILRSP